MTTFQRSVWVFWAVTALAGVTCACGGSVANAGPDGGGPDGGSEQSGPWSPVCPESAPAVGSPCTQDMLQCEYGDAWWNVSCDVVMQCMGGQWTADTQLSDPTTCTPKPGPNVADCPQSPMDVGTGTVCAQVDEQCFYGQNGNCTCTITNAGPPPDTDAAPKPYWQCVPGPGCPGIRQRLGSACTSTNLCFYVVCGYQQVCQDGVWQGGFWGKC
jgi:hypothetical protein